MRHVGFLLCTTYINLGNRIDLQAAVKKRLNSSVHLNRRRRIIANMDKKSYMDGGRMIKSEAKSNYQTDSEMKRELDDYTLTKSINYVR